MTRAWLLAATLITFALVASAAHAANAAVTIQNAAFSPATVTIDAGGSVTWTNLDRFGHSARADSGAFDTGIFSSGSRSVTIATAGTYGYFCAVHPVMRGTVHVLGAATPAPTTPPATAPPPTAGPASVAPPAPTAAPTVAAPQPTVAPTPEPTATTAPPSPVATPAAAAITPSPVPVAAQLTPTPTAAATVAATTASRASDGPNALLIAAAVIGLTALAGVGVRLARKG